MASVGFQDSQKTSINFSMSVDNGDDDDLCQRIEEYKHQNPEDVEELKRCIHDVLGEAERTAQERLDKKAVSSEDDFPITVLEQAINIYDVIIGCLRLPQPQFRLHADSCKKRFPSISFPFRSQIDEAKEKNLNAFMSGLKDKNKRVVTRARSLARSLIDTICNCTNNVSNPIQQAATRLRRQQTAYERSSSSPRQQTRFED